MPSPSRLRRARDVYPGRLYNCFSEYCLQGTLAAVSWDRPLLSAGTVFRDRFGIFLAYVLHGADYITLGVLEHDECAHGLHHERL